VRDAGMVAGGPPGSGRGQREPGDRPASCLAVSGIRLAVFAGAGRNAVTRLGAMTVEGM
jgi:hypothetical protein